MNLFLLDNNKLKLIFDKVLIYGLNFLILFSIINSRINISVKNMQETILTIQSQNNDLQIKAHYKNRSIQFTTKNCNIVLLLLKVKFRMWWITLRENVNPSF